jgi:hypothetical protein
VRFVLMLWVLEFFYVKDIVLVDFFLYIVCKKKLIMKITNIKEDGDGIFHVTFSPNKIEKIFGEKEKVVKLRELDEYTYRYHEGVSAYCYEDGHIVPRTNKIVDAIEAYKRRSGW